MSTKPKYKEFENRIKRINSFSKYPWYYPAKEDLVNAGFFYDCSKDQDYSQCYFCGLKILEWIREDDPMKKHKEYRKNCRVVLDHQNPERSGASNNQNTNAINSTQIPSHTTQASNYQLPGNNTKPPVSMPLPTWKPGDPIPLSGASNNQNTSAIDSAQIPSHTTQASNYQLPENNIKPPVSMPLPTWKPGDPIPLSGASNNQNTSAINSTQIPSHITQASNYQLPENNTKPPVSMPQPTWKPGDPIPLSGASNNQNTSAINSAQIPSHTTQASNYQLPENNTKPPVSMPQPTWKPGDPIPLSGASNIQNTSAINSTQIPSHITQASNYQLPENNTKPPVSMPQPTWKPGDPLPGSGASNIQNTSEINSAQIPSHITQESNYQLPENNTKPPVSMPQPTWKPGDPLPGSGASNIQKINSAQIPSHTTQESNYQLPENNTKPPVSMPQPTWKPGDPLPLSGASNIQNTSEINSTQIPSHTTQESNYQLPENNTKPPVSMPQNTSAINSAHTTAPSDTNISSKENQYQFIHTSQETNIIPLSKPEQTIGQAPPKHTQLLKSPTIQSSDTFMPIQFVSPLPDLPPQHNNTVEQVANTPTTTTLATVPDPQGILAETYTSTLSDVSTLGTHNYDYRPSQVANTAFSQNSFWYYWNVGREWLPRLRCTIL